MKADIEWLRQAAQSRAFGTTTHMLLQPYVDEIERLRRIETLALIWSAYQDDKAKGLQSTDAGFRAQAENAERELFEALI